MVEAYANLHYFHAPTIIFRSRITRFSTTTTFSRRDSSPLIVDSSHMASSCSNLSREIKYFGFSLYVSEDFDLLYNVHACINKQTDSKPKNNCWQRKNVKEFLIHFFSYRNKVWIPAHFLGSAPSLANVCGPINHVEVWRRWQPRLILNKLTNWSP